MSSELVNSIPGLLNSNLCEVLPDELLEAIFKYIVSTKDLKSLCLVNRQVSTVTRKLLWQEPSLKRFTLEQFKWISRMPIEVLDLRCFNEEFCQGNDFESYMVELFKGINQMDHLKHLKINRGILYADKKFWSMQIDHCQLSTLSICSEARLQRANLKDLMYFTKLHMPHFKYLEFLIVEDEIDGFDILKLQQPLTFDSKLQELSIKVNDLGFNPYAKLFQVLRYFSGLKILHLKVKIEEWQWVFRKTDLLKAKNDFMAKYPQCEVITEIELK